MPRAAYSFKLHGIEELMRNLEELPTIAMQKTVIRNALQKAAKPIADVAKSYCPQGPTGNLAKSIKISTVLKRSQRKGRYTDPKAVEVFVGSTSPHAHLVEFGTVERILPKPRKVELDGHWVEIKTTGKMPANPFMRRAWDSTKDMALKIFTKEMRNELYKAAKRLAKRAEMGKLTKAQMRGLFK